MGAVRPSSCLAVGRELDHNASSGTVELFGGPHVPTEASHRSSD